MSHESESPEDGDFSLAKLVNRLGDVQTARDVSEVFRRDACKLLQRLDEAVAARDATEIARLGHRIRGSASMLGADRVSELGAELERASLAATETEEKFGEIADAVNRLRDEYGTVFVIIDGYMGK